MIIKEFVVTEDTVFVAGKIYYNKTVSDGNYIFSPATDVIVGEPIPDGELALVYYELTVESESGFTYTYFPETTSETTDEEGNTINIVRQEVLRVNHITGETINYINETRTTNVTSTTYTNVELERFTSASVLVGQIYRFVFLGSFVNLGYSLAHDHPEETGMYRVDRIFNYRELLTSDISIYDNLYKPLGLPKAMYEADMSRFNEKTTFYKLVDPLNEQTVYYMPDIFIAEHPDTNVSRYCKLMLAFTLGVFNNPTELAELNTAILALLETRYGISSVANVMTYRDVYLTTQDFEAIQATRAATKANSTIDLYDVLFTNEKGIKEQEILTLRGKIAAYEELLTTE